MSPEYPNIPKQNPPCSDVEIRNVVSYWGFFSKLDLLTNPGALLMLDVDWTRVFFAVSIVFQTAKHCR